MQKLFGILIVLVSGFMAMVAAGAENLKHDDQVVMSLSAEGWVTTDSAIVHVSAEAIQQSETADQLKKTINGALMKLSAKGSWRFTHFSRVRDKTGLTRWRADAQARLPEAALNGLGKRAKEASRPGFSLSIGRTDFSPSLEEFEQARSDLRQRLYGRIGAELTLLNGAFPARKYRLKEAYFDQPRMSPRRAVRPARMTTMSEQAIAPTPPAKVGVARKITMTARIVFGAQEPQVDGK